MGAFCTTLDADGNPVDVFKEEKAAVRQMMRNKAGRPGTCGHATILDATIIKRRQDKEAKLAELARLERIQERLALGLGPESDDGQSSVVCDNNNEVEQESSETTSDGDSDSVFSDGDERGEEEDGEISRKDTFRRPPEIDLAAIFHRAVKSGGGASPLSPLHQEWKRSFPSVAPRDPGEGVWVNAAKEAAIDTQAPSDAIETASRHSLSTPSSPGATCSCYGERLATIHAPSGLRLQRLMMSDDEVLAAQQRAGHYSPFSRSPRRTSSPPPPRMAPCSPTLSGMSPAFSRSFRSCNSASPPLPSPINGSPGAHGPLGGASKWAGTTNPFLVGANHRSSRLLGGSLAAKKSRSWPSNATYIYS